MKDFLQAVRAHVKGLVGVEERRRADICAECPMKEVREYSRIFNSKMENVNGYVCIECNCPLATKIFAKEPDNICHKWKQ